MSPSTDTDEGCM